MTNGEASPQGVRTPEPTSHRISTLIHRINEGDIKVPTFQRRRVWNVQQVIDLLDSVNRGYPVGSLLFWNTGSRLHSERNIGGFSLPETRDKYPRNYVLDGQQRLTTLYAVLTRPAESLEVRFRVVYDLKQGDFVETGESIESHQFPLNLTYDPSAFLDFLSRLRGLENGSYLVTEAQRLWNTFQNYELPVITVPEASLDRVGIIFERINSRGTRLTIFDLMVAATWAKEGSEEFDLRGCADRFMVGG